MVRDVFPDNMTFNEVVKEVLTGYGGGVGEAGNSLVPTHPQAKRTRAGLVLAWKEGWRDRRGWITQGLINYVKDLKLYPNVNGRSAHTTRGIFPRHG